MVTNYIIQKRYTLVGEEWAAYRYWHDRFGSPKFNNKPDAIEHYNMLTKSGLDVDYRLIKRTDKILKV
jgi:hypothetical protein